ncbi:Csa1 family protein [Clostridium tertium]
MISITGCSNVINKPSDKEIVGKFAEFVNMFPTEDLTVLYDKNGNGSDLKAGDLGTWQLSSYKYSISEKGDEKIGVIIRFNRNTKEAKGIFIKSVIKDEETIEDIEYPIYYDKDGLHFVDKNMEASIVEELSNFKIMYEFISIDREYLNTLKSKDIFYNEEVPLYGATYKLTAEDKNIKKIKELYPDVVMDENNLILDFMGNGTPWKTTSYLSLWIRLDDKNNNYFKANMSFKKSDTSENVSSEE